MCDHSLKSLTQSPSGSRPVGDDKAECPFIMASYNVGLLTDHVIKEGFPAKFLSTFTKNLTTDIESAFRDQNVNVLFLCELGNMKDPQKIDQVFETRYEIANREKTTPETCPCDRSKCLHDYLEKLLKNAGLGNLKISCVGPYACIWDSQWVGMRTEPEIFCPSPSNTNRIAVAFAFMHNPSRLDVNVVCCHSPSSKKWDKLDTGVKKTRFSKIVSTVQVVPKTIALRSDGLSVVTSTLSQGTCKSGRRCTGPTQLRTSKEAIRWLCACREQLPSRTPRRARARCSAS